ncbi:MAG: hypothetical protein FJ117_14795 [Deltaproteobacteria bacterium]|nr:hypothetical protein [Deltaproteobacteria bacterium]
MKPEISCSLCRQPLMTARMKERLLQVAKEKKIRNYEEWLFLCGPCKLNRFSRRLVGDNLNKVPRAKPVPHRRTEKLEPMKHDSRLGTTVYKSECFSCNQGCDAVVHVKEGRVVRVEGDASSHVTKGILCSKALTSPEHIHHRERILYPLKRAGRRGEGQWERISWDEALDTVVRRLKETEKKYGKEGVMLATGTSRGTKSRWCRVQTIPPREAGGELHLDFVPVMCFQCEDPMCAQFCPVEAIVKKEDCRVLVEEEKFIGCRQCIAGCPYGTMYFNEVTRKAGKCNLCQSRTEYGIEPRKVLPPGHPFSSWEICPPAIATDMNANYYSALRVKSLADVLFPSHGPGYIEKTREFRDR